MKHTKGPWFVHSKKEYIAITAKETEGNPKWDIARSWEDANARLISAAPELLEALKHARQQLIALCSEYDVPNSVNLAIAKAEGK